MIPMMQESNAVLRRPDSALVANDYLISINALAKRFPERRRLGAMLLNPRGGRFNHAVQAFSCDIERGELFGLLGPNGAGKSTLFRLLSTLILPDSGSARIAGYDLTRDAHEVRALVGYVNSDERSLNWRISARENLRFYASLYRIRGELIASRIRDVLKTVDLTETGNRMVGQFSSGMRQRLLIARTLLPRPRVMLLDEPTRSLDPIAARRFREFLRRDLVEKEGCTVLLATHNAEEAMNLCDRVAVLNRGRLLALGSVEALSRQLAGNRLQITTRTPNHPGIDRLVRTGMIADVFRHHDDDGWSMVQFSIVSQNTHASDLLSVLVRDGLEVSEFQRIRPALADMIDAIVHRSGIV